MTQLSWCWCSTNLRAKALGRHVFYIYLVIYEFMGVRQPSLTESPNYHVAKFVPTDLNALCKSVALLRDNEQWLIGALTAGCSICKESHSLFVIFKTKTKVGRSLKNWLHCDFVSQLKLIKLFSQKVSSTTRDFLYQATSLSILTKDEKILNWYRNNKILSRNKN